MRLALLLAAYLACAVIAILTVPAGAFIPYGLTTWCGGALFVLLANEYRRGRSPRRRSSCTADCPVEQRESAPDNH